MDYSNKRLFVTGGAGFIGSNFCHYWLNRYPNSTLIAYDLLTYAGNINNLNGLEKYSNFYFIKGDINNEILIENCLVKYKINAIVHFAAESHVDRSIEDPDIFIKTNVLGTHSLLKAAKKVWIDNHDDVIQHRFHHVSTDEVYGSLNHDDPPFTENTIYSPNSPYSASKAASDHLVQAYQKTYGLNTSISNCSNNYGPYHFPEKLIPLTITNILNNKAIPIYGDGKQIRDWLYVEDHCKGIECILNSDKINERYNIGGNNEWFNVDIVSLICNLIDDIFYKESKWAQVYPNAAPALGYKSLSLIEYVNDRPGHDVRYAINANKIKDVLSFKIDNTFYDGIQKTIEWYLNNSQWWLPLI